MTAATLTEFLLARIAEDQRDARKLAETDRRPVLSLAMTVNHPERLLADCEAKRRIVSRCAPTLMDEWPTREWSEERDVRETVLRDLASIYADHPDYRDEWRP